MAGIVSLQKTREELDKLIEKQKIIVDLTTAQTKNYQAQAIAVKQTVSSVKEGEIESLKKRNALLKETAILAKQKGDLDKLKITQSRQLEKLEQDKITTDTKILVLEQKRIAADNKRIAANKKLIADEEKKEKATQKAIKSTNFLSSAYGKLQAKVKKAEQELKQIAATFGVNSKEAQKAAKSFGKLEDKLAKINNLARDGRKNVGRYELGLGGATRGALSLGKSLVGAFGIVGGLQLFASVAKDAFNIVREFSKAQSELASLMGKSKSEISSLTELFKQLGESTVFSATEVTKAAIELAKLGLESDQIKASLKGVLDGAVAMGVGINESASLSTKTMNAFGLSANESERVVSTLAVATTKSALDFEFLNDSMSFAATGAKNFGQNVETTTAQLGVLADNGIKASTAGTSLRKIFTQLSIKGLTLDEALTTINNATDKNVASFDLFGATAKDAGVILAENKKQVIELTAAITKQDEALKKMIEERLDNLDGDIRLLSSAWEGFILSFSDGEGVMSDVLRGVIQLLTILLQTFSKVNKIFKQFFKVLREEFKPLSDLIDRLTAGFGEFNAIGFITNQIIRTMVIGLKATILPFRILFQLIMSVGDAYDFALNKAKMFLNVLGASFEVDESLNLDAILKRFSNIKDAVIDTFTIDEIDTASIQKWSDEVIDIVKKTKKTIGSGSGEGDDGDGDIIDVDSFNKAFEDLVKKERNDAFELEKFKRREAAKTMEQKIRFQQFLAQHEIDTATLTGAEIELIQLKLQKKIAEIKSDEAKKTAELQKELTDASLSLLEKGLDRLFEFYKTQRDEELASSKKVQDKILKSIDSGTKTAKESLALENKKQAELIEKQAKADKQRLLIETLIAILKNGNSGEKAGALQNITSVVGGIDGALYEGTDRVGSTGSETMIHSGKDGYNAMLDKGEMVLNGRQTDSLSKDFGIDTREDIFSMARRSVMPVNGGSSVIVASQDNSYMIDSLSQIRDELKGLKIEVGVNISRDWWESNDKRGRTINNVRKRANR